MKEYRLTIISGNNVGKAQIINSYPVTLGRSSKNDFAVPDELLSRHHCSIDMRNNELWLTDLASANGTAVNGKIIDEIKLSVGDIIQIGDTSIKLTEASENATTMGSAVPEQKIHNPILPSIKAEAPKQAHDGKIDLGFNSSSGSTEQAKEQKKKDIKAIRNLAIVAISTFAIVGIFMLLFLNQKNESEDPSTTAVKALEPSLEFYYTEIEATESNIFRYEIKLTHDGYLIAIVDDLAQGRHVEKKSEHPISKELILSLREKIHQAGFSTLADLYEDINKQGEWNETSITIIDTKDVKTVRFVNKQFHKIFASVRDELRAFAETELDLKSINDSKEKLEESALESILLADKFYAEMEIAPDNLFKAIRNYSKAIEYLENFSPKPDAYDIAFDRKREAEAILEEKLQNLESEVQLARRLEDWETAADYLRELRAMIPDRHDPRYQEYNRQLLQAEDRIRTTH